MFTLFEVLSKDERIIVYSSEEDGVFYTWNQSLTLQCWAEVKPVSWSDGNAGWEELSIRTLGGKEPRGYVGARKAAIAWHVEDQGTIDPDPRHVTVRR